MSVNSLESIAATMADRKARADEYARYRARHPIDIDGVRAYNEGDPVPVGAVEGFSREVGKFTYDPSIGRHMPVFKADGVTQVMTSEDVYPTVPRDAVYEVGKAGEDPNVDPPEPPKRPADNASLDRWREFATSQGMDPDEALGITDKAEFVSRYPKVEG